MPIVVTHFWPKIEGKSIDFNLTASFPLCYEKCFTAILIMVENLVKKSLLPSTDFYCKILIVGKIWQLVETEEMLI